MPGRRLAGLDGWRAIAIILVVAHHLAASSGWEWSQTNLGVCISFTLSGFLITWVLLEEEAATGVISLKSFYQRRALRILPPVLTFLAITLALAPLGLTDATFRDTGWCLLFVRNLLGKASITTHFWSLSVEEQFYLLWPAMLIFAGKKARLKVALTFLALAPLWRFVNNKWLGPPDLINQRRFDLCFVPILLGCTLALIRFDPKLIHYVRNRFVQSRAMLVFSIALIIGLFHFGHGSVIGFVAIAVAINESLDHSERWGGILNSAPATWIAKRSYSIYIWQELFCLNSRVGWLSHFPQNVLATLAVASVSYHFIDAPLARLRKRMKSKQAAELAPAGRCAEPSLSLIVASQAVSAGD